MNSSIKKKLGITVAVLVLCLALGRISGMWQFYSIPTPSMEPALMMGSYVIGTNLSSLERNDYMVFRLKKDQNITGGGSIYTKRLIALPGDKLQIIGGEVFVNGKSADKGLNLKYRYECSNLDRTVELREQDLLGRLDAQKMMVTISNEDLPKFASCGCSRTLIDSKFVDPSLKTFWKGDFNTHFFGPIIIPEGKYFAMGDNRDNSLDCRYLGYIEEQDVIGEIIFVF